jgi:hypothetical protein
MADAVDTADSKPAKNSKAKDTASPQGSAQKRWAKEKRDAKSKNPVTETFYELLGGKKLLFCKRRKSGTVMRTLVGSVDDKQGGAVIREEIKKLEASGKLKNRLEQFSPDREKLPPAPPTED